jgi:nucleoside-diphosphate-sugar epimerase
MSKVLVSGAGGYVGTILVEYLLKSGHKVVALDRYFFGLDKIEHLICENLKILKDDIRFFNEKILSDIDVVIDLAGLSNDATSEINPVFTKEINCDGSIRLATLSKKHKIKHYIYSSSASVYGFSEKKFLKETDKLNPLTEYAKSKFLVEKKLNELFDKNFNITILRNSTIYGLSPRMRFDLAVNIMSMRGFKEGIIYIMGDGLQWRPFVHVRDVVRAFTMCMDNPDDCRGETFNVGSNEQNYSIRNLAEYISQHIPNSKVIYIPDNPDHRSYSLNFDKINKKLGYKTIHNIKEGVNEIVQALNSGLDHNDPTFHTLKWYQNLINWESKLNDLKIYDRIL